MKNIKLLLTIGVVIILGAVVTVGVVAYQFLKPTEAASGPIQAVPVQAQATSDSASATLFQIDQASSEARFVINEVLRGTPTEVVGATSQVAGQISVDPADPASTQVGTITINARTLATDSSQRDRAIQNEILSTNQYEYISFTPTSLQGVPGNVSLGQPYTFQMVGKLTIRGVERDVTFDVTVTPVAENRLQGTATATINYADWGVSIPNVPFVASVDNNVQLELNFVANAA
ncbi:MAG: YceI family protein [Chloroflexi bacterium]|nr:YceI family protein [Chloroflexota bacterium]